jgi:hypothetical protein
MLSTWSTRHPSIDTSSPHAHRSISAMRKSADLLGCRHTDLAAGASCFSVQTLVGLISHRLPKIRSYLSSGTVGTTANGSCMEVMYTSHCLEPFAGHLTLRSSAAVVCGAEFQKEWLFLACLCTRKKNLGLHLGLGSLTRLIARSDAESKHLK